MIIAFVITCFFYLTLVLELTVWHIPSVATSGKIMSAKSDLVSQYSDKYKKIFELSKSIKIIIFIVPLVFIYVLHLYPISIIIDFINGRTQSSLAYYTLASSIVLLGRIISLVYIFKIRKENEQKDDKFRLHTDSVFRYSRNPGLMSLYISFIGFGLMIPTVFYWVCLFIYIGHMHFKVLMEEDFLGNKFGSDYISYINKSKRYL